MELIQWSRKKPSATQHSKVHFVGSGNKRKTICGFPLPQDVEYIEPLTGYVTCKICKRLGKPFRGSL